MKSNQTPLVAIDRATRTILIGSIASIACLSSCSIISKYRGEPSTWNKTSDRKKVTTKQTTPILNKTPSTAPAQQSLPEITPDYAKRAPRKVSKKISGKGGEKGRTVHGLVEPDVSKIPTKKDLQEVNTPTGPTPSGPSITVPSRQ